MLPRWEYAPEVASGPQPRFWHRDFARRETVHPLTDRYLHSGDGKLRTLMIACSDDVWKNALSRKNEATWRRTYVRKMAPYRVRFASWVVNYSNGSYTVELVQSLVFMVAMMVVVRLNIMRCPSRGTLIRPDANASFFSLGGLAFLWNTDPDGMALQRQLRTRPVQVLW